MNIHEQYVHETLNKVHKHYDKLSPQEKQLFCRIWENLTLKIYKENNIFTESLAQTDVTRLSSILNRFKD